MTHTGIGSHWTSILLRVLDLLSYTGSAVHTVTFGGTIMETTHSQRHECAAINLKLTFYIDAER